MKAQVSKLRRVLLGVAVVTAFAATPAFADMTPTVIDTGSTSGTVRIHGTGFIPAWGGWWSVARVQIYNPYDGAFVEDTVPMDQDQSILGCLPFSPDLCVIIGTFNFQKSMAGHPCGSEFIQLQKPVRFARAQDLVSQEWTGWAELGCD